MFSRRAVRKQVVRQIAIRLAVRQDPRGLCRADLLPTHAAHFRDNITFVPLTVLVPDDII